MAKKTKRKISTTSSNKTRIKTKTKKDFKFWICYLIVALALFIIGYFTLGWMVTCLYLFVVTLLLLLARGLDRIDRRKTQRKILKVILIFILFIGLLGMISVSGFFIYIVNIGNKQYAKEKLTNKEATILYDKDKNIITTLGLEKREKVSYDDISEVFIDALIATEDSRYFQHNGFDPLRFTKASIGQVLTGSEAGGASTLTMQVVKNNFTSTEQSIIRKFTDIYISIFKLEKDYSKEEIIEFYVNDPYLGSNSYGVEQASLTYFGKSISEVNLSEAALLAGLFQAPASYDPNVNPSLAQERRSIVLSLMKRHGYITEEERVLADSIPVESLIVKNATSGVVDEYQGYIDTVIQEVIDKTSLDPAVTPMIIYTNMDKKAQSNLNDVMNGKTYKWRNSTIQAGVAAIDVDTGKVIAIGAGRNIKTARGYNFATDINRQIGSTAKPLFDYGPGIEYNNWSTGQMFLDEKYKYSSGTSINNWDGKYRGALTLRQALSQSRNIPALKAFQQVETSKIIEFVTSLGITPEIDAYGNIHEAHSIGGFNGASPLEMAAAYAAFANGGTYYEPYTVNKIVLRDTNEEMSFESDGTKVMSDSTAYMITDILQKGVASGTISLLSVSGYKYAAKTGTTDYDSNTRKTYGLSKSAINDAWVVGYTPDVSIALWYGYKEIKDPETGKVNSITMSNASADRKKIYKELLKAIAPKNNSGFKKPFSVVSVKIEKGTNPVQLPSENTPEDKIITELFKRGTEPTEVSKTYQTLPDPTNLLVTSNGSMASLSWDPVINPIEDNEFQDLGDFGYEIYKDGVYIGFTKNTTYSFQTFTTNGTYIVKTAFTKTNVNKSVGASYTYTSGITSSELTVSLNSFKTENLKIGDTYYDLASPVKVTYNNIDVTESANISVSIYKNNQLVTEILSTEAQTYKIIYEVSYNGQTKSVTKTIIYS